MKDPECVTRKVKIAPHDYLKENFLATFTPQKQLTPEQIFWSQDLIKLKSEALKEQTIVSRPIKALTVRITPTELTEEERGFEQTKECYLKEARCLELEAELANLCDKSHHDNQEELINCFSKREKIEKANLLVERDDRTLKVRTTDSQFTQLNEQVTNLQAQNDLFRAKNDRIKQHYKELYDSIKIIRAKHIEQELLEYAIGTCPQNIQQRDKQLAHIPLIRKKQVTFAKPSDKLNSNTYKHVVKVNTQKNNVPVPPSTGVNSYPNASRSQPRSNTKKNRILPAKGVNKLPVEEQSRTNKSLLRTSNRVDSSSRIKRIVVQIVLWYLDSGCSKHMTGDRSRLMNFMKNFIETVRFGNDHFGAIMGYGDYMIGDSVISRVYYVEGLRHNLFSVGQFYDSDLEVAFKKHSCYVRDTDGVKLINGSRGSNLYTISIEDIMNSSLIYLLSKASKNKSWLWYRRLNHLNFGTINDLK
nr:integrase, catalytic region, zinc finger, CCHC-type, peptidase aspartic, catalytic [Tanacetum cinerariifolium]